MWNFPLDRSLQASLRRTIEERSAGLSTVRA